MAAFAARGGGAMLRKKRKENVTETFTSTELWLKYLGNRKTLCTHTELIPPPLFFLRKDFSQLSNK